MELQELPRDLLQPQVTVVAILGEVLATTDSLASLEEDVMLCMSPGRWYWKLEDFTNELHAALNWIYGIWWRSGVTPNDVHYVDVPLTSLSQALAAYEGTPWTTWFHVKVEVRDWVGSVAGLVDSWAGLARAATKLLNTLRTVATEVANVEANATTWARELWDEAAHYGTAQENMMELNEALGGEEGAEEVARYVARYEAREAAREAATAAMVRKRVEVALGLLERLVAMCDKATVFPRELQRRVKDIEATVEGTNEESPDVPEDLVSRVAVAERLWEASACLAKDHLLGTVDYMFKFYFCGGPTGPSACGVAERCLRATEDIPKLVQPPERPQSFPAGSPVSMELQEMKEMLFNILATLTGPHRRVRRHVSPKSLRSDRRSVIRRVRKTVGCRGVTSLGHRGVTSLGQAQAAKLVAKLGAILADARAAAEAWRESAATLRMSRDRLTEEATEIRDACEDVATTTATAPACNQQDEGARTVIPRSNGMAAGCQQLLVALDREEVISAGTSKEKVATNNAMGEAVVATSQARVATRRGQQVEVALGLLKRFVDMCDKGTMFTWDMQCQLRAMEATVEETKEASPGVSEALMNEAVEAKQMWEASTRLATRQLQETLGEIQSLLLNICGGPSGRTLPKRH